MRALLVGGGGREHAIGLSIVGSGTELFVIAPNKNPGLARIAKRVVVGDENDVDWVTRSAVKLKPDCVFIGLESPLASGVPDALLKKGLTVFAPSSAAARLETSKAYCRRFLGENNVEGDINSEQFTDPQRAEDFIKRIDYDFVIKPDGLTGGKGVVVQGTHFKSKEDGVRIVRDYLRSGKGSLLVEEKMTGEEFSLQAFVSGRRISFLPIVQDYKRAFEGDSGPNTGGMGSICFSERGLPFIDPSTVVKAKNILRDLVEKFSERVVEYVGPIYGGFIATADGPKLLEINARLGDPEAINVLSLMETSIVDVASEMLEGKEPKLEFRDKVNVLRYLVPVGYGSKPVPSTIQLDEAGLRSNGLRVYYASVNISGKKLKQTSSRSLALVAEGSTHSEAIQKFDGLSHLVKGDYAMRNDIGTEKMIEEKKRFMAAVIAGRA